MKKKIMLICVLVLFIVAGVVAAVVFFNNNNNKNQNSYELLGYTCSSEVREFINANELAESVHDEDFYTSILEYEILNSIADVEFIYSEDESVYSLIVSYNLFIHDFSDGNEYTFTAKDKEKIEEEFNKIKTAFGEYLGCELEQYDLVPVKVLEKIEDTDEAFYNGDVIREYSVRDSNGVLWILTFEASAGTSSAKLEKIMDEGEYMGFIPSIDLTK